MIYDIKTVCKYDASNKGDVDIYIYAQPGASKNQVVGIYDGPSDSHLTKELKIKLRAPPVDGKANESLIKFLAEIFDLPTSRISIVRGESSRHKVLRLAGVTLAYLESKSVFIFDE